MHESNIGLSSASLINKKPIAKFDYKITHEIDSISGLFWTHILC